jgi:hypothetical protein
MDKLMQPNKLANMTPEKPYPTTQNNNNNNYHLQSPDEDDATVGASNCSHSNLTHKPPQEIAFQVAGINVASDHAIANAGATGHFVLPGTPSLMSPPRLNRLSLIYRMANNSY